MGKPRKKPWRAFRSGFHVFSGQTHLRRGTNDSSTFGGFLFSCLMLFTLYLKGRGTQRETDRLPSQGPQQPELGQARRKLGTRTPSGFPTGVVGAQALELYYLLPARVHVTRKPESKAK